MTDLDKQILLSLPQNNYKKLLRRKLQADQSLTFLLFSSKFKYQCSPTVPRRINRFFINNIQKK